MSIRVPYETVKSTVTQAFLNLGLSQEKAEKCAEIHTESSLEGIESHGLNRVPRFAEYVQKGWVDINAEPELVGAKGAVENYDGHLGIGTLNATFCMDRAVALAKEHGIGCVALKNTTHWMRGGSYAWQAAQAGFIGISWTNTESCMLSGSVLGTAVLLDGITARIEEELGRPATLVVTGGLAKYVTPLCRHPLTYDPELLLKGLALLYQLNAPQQHHHLAGGRKPHGQNFRRHRPFRRERHETEAKAG